MKGYGNPVPPSERTEVKPGDTWSWTQPDGKRRTIFVERIQFHMNQRRAYGHHPTGTKRIQVPVSLLELGRFDAKLESRNPNYEWHPVNGWSSCTYRG